ncbi:MAG TPA: tRNA (adenosine(37)-N6)-dimethylallyltransferase MiaA, partial [Candidatus Polarisedimenticolia bacterium]|nr:tRNA (adenosine(37)-N6)-dimethylallyltransferase MiaA [Candidatus Polarisedimenticolia bacterium]
SDQLANFVESGWLDEVRKLIAAGVPPDAKPFQFIGYSEMRKYVEGGVTLEAATKQIQQATRRFAKRQITWFRKEPAVQWLRGFGDDPEISAAALEVVRRIDT